MSKTINFSNIVNAFSRGNVPISRIYARGNKLVWSKTQSYEDQYMTIECVYDGDFTFTGTWETSSSTEHIDITLYYSKNGGSWTEITSLNPVTLSAVAGDKFRFKGTNDAISPDVNSKQTHNTFRFGSGQYKAYGNVMSLLFGDNFKTATLTPGTNNSAFKDLFNQYNNLNNYCLLEVEHLILPTLLVPHCFRSMFQNNYGFSSAPELLATVLVDSCYRYMFNTCRYLTYIKCLATSGINTSNSTYNWLGSVASKGIFIKDAEASWPSGSNGIPSYWGAHNPHTNVPDVPTITCTDNVVTITSNDEIKIYYRKYGTSTWTEYTSPFEIYTTATYEAYAWNDVGNSAICNPVECTYVGYADQYFTVELTASGSFAWKMYGADASFTIQYSKNNGAWTSITSDTTGVSISGSAGDKFRFKGINDRYTANNSNYNRNYSYFDLTTNCYIYGNIMSLINGDNFVGTGLTSSNNYAFCSLFKPTDTSTGSRILDAQNLILPVGSTDGCFRAMFSNSKNMLLGPQEVKLQEGGIALYVCYYMFENCTALTKTPDLPTVTNGASYIYQNMFRGCTSLTSCKCLLASPTFTSSGSCYRMFYGVTTNGTLRKNPSATWNQSTNAVPTTWTILDAE